MASPRAKFSDRNCSKEVEFGAKLLHSIEKPPIAIKGVFRAIRFMRLTLPNYSRNPLTNSLFCAYIATWK
jgi:hypothetical protein